jgi:hypothetical protein
LELASNSKIKHHKINKDVQGLQQYLYKNYQYSRNEFKELRHIGKALAEKILNPKNWLELDSYRTYTGVLMYYLEATKFC